MLILNETTLFFFELTSNANSPQVNTSGVVLNWASKVALASLPPPACILYNH